MSLEKMSFAGHETFPFRYSWLKKGLDFVLEEGQEAFSSDEAIAVLGVGKNMVRSIRHWCLVTKILEEDKAVSNNRGRYLSPSWLGNLIFDAENGGDPYLEDPATLWLIHWQIATNSSKATTWFWAFNHLNQVEFFKKTLNRELQSLAESQSCEVSSSSIARDVDCFIRTYVPSHNISSVEDTIDCPLVELELIREFTEHQSYQFVYGPKEQLPNDIFVYALLEFWSNIAKESQAKTLSLEEITFAPSSPGRVFKLDADSIVDRLEQLELHTGGSLIYDETAGLRQVSIKDILFLKDRNTWLQKYYGTNKKLSKKISEKVNAY